MAVFIYLVLAVLFLLYLSLRYSDAKILINQVPGPVLIPFIGNIWGLYGSSAEKTWDATLNLVEKFYPIVQIQYLRRNIVLIRHPDDLKALYTCKDSIQKSTMGYENFAYIGVHGLINSGGDKWFQRRKMLNPAFAQPLLKIYSKIQEEHADKLIAELKSGGQTIIKSIFPTLDQLGFGVVCEAILGIDLNKVDREDIVSFIEAVKTVGEVTSVRATRPYVADWMMPFLSMGRQQNQGVKFANYFLDKVMQERRKYRKNEVLSTYYELMSDVTNEVDFEKGTGKRRMAVLDLLLAAEEENLIDQEGIREELLVFVVAGYETTAAAIAFTLLLLAENKEAQDRARTEVNDIISKAGEKVTLAELKKFEYLGRCIKEAMRIFPSVPITGRTLRTKKKLRDYILPVGTEVIFHTFATHRDPKFWPDPLKFDPDRFLPEAVHARHPFAYTPFSAGLRNCIGRKFAMLEIKSVVSKILRNFTIEPVDSTATMKFSMTMILRPTKPMHIKFIQRNHQ